jgi:catechol 2,3-dioxygenase-like lactoylglutathione lyase family enzyme
VKPKFTYVGIRVKDLDESISFYSKLFGMKLADRSKILATHGETATLVSEEGGFPLELNFYEKKSLYDKRYTVGEGLDHLGFRVESIDGTIAMAKKMGCRLPRDVKTKTSRWAYLEDPNGIWIEIFQ